MRNRTKLGLILVFIVASSTLRAEPCSSDSAERAKVFYNEGAARYRLGELTRAAELFKQSYEACQSPTLLYNIGQTYRLAKDNEKALFFFKQYLSAASLDDPDRAEAEKRIAQIQSQRAAQPSSQPSPPSGARVDSSSSPTRAELLVRAPERRKPVYRRAWFWGVIVGGAIVVGAGVTLAVVLSSKTIYPSTMPSNGTFQF